MAQDTRPPHDEAPIISRWLAEHPMAPDQDITIAQLGQTDSSSVHLVQIRHGESLHVHQQHDLVAILQRGHGTLRVGSEVIPVKSGSVVTISRNTPHAFVNASRQPAAALVVFSPPFDGTDTVSVDE